MAETNAIARAVAEFAKTSGFKKKASSWYLARPETIVVLNLQRSQWGPRYFVNVGVWISELELLEFPKAHQCHITTRLEALTAGAVPSLAKLLDLSELLDDRDRMAQLRQVFVEHLVPVLAASISVASLRSASGRALAARSLVNAKAQALLASPTVPKS